MRNTPKSLNEELMKMRKLMNFDISQNSHDVLSESNISEVNPLLWTKESAMELHKKILSETLREVETIKEQKEESDDVIINDLLKSVSKDFGEDIDSANGFMEYMYQYLEKLAGDSTEEEVMSEQYLVDTPFFNYWRRKWKGMVKKIKYSKLWDKLSGSGKLKKYLKKTKQELKRKWRNFKDDVRQHFTKQLRKKWIDGKSIDFGYAHSIKIGKYKPSQSKEMISSDKYKVSTPIDKWDEILNSKIAKKMVRKMPKFSKGKWNELINDKEHKGFAVSAVEYFKETNPKFKWKKVLVGRDSTLIIDKIPIEKDVPGEPKKFPTITYDLPQFGNGSQLFEDNELCINGAPEFKKQMDDLFFGVEEIMSVLNPPEDKPKCAIKSISIESSCSRFRNGKSNKCGGGPYTFEELSKKRLETAKNYIFGKIKSLGIVEDNLKESYKWDGTNGDGSSGPQPPSKFAFIPIGKGVPMSPHCNSGESECDLDYDGKTPANLTEIDGYVEVVRGNVLGSRKDYEEFKYIRGKLELVFNDTTIPEDPEVDPNKEEEFELVEIEGTEYPIIFYTPPKSPFELKLPTLRFNFKKGAKEGDKPNKEHGSTECAAFG